MSEIYFYKGKYAKAVNVAIETLPSGRHACRHKKTGKILIDMHKIFYDSHSILDKLDFDDKFSLCVSHEILHDAITQCVNYAVSTQFDALVLKYWGMNVDINTNLEV